MYFLDMKIFFISALIVQSLHVLSCCIFVNIVVTDSIAVYVIAICFINTDTARRLLVEVLKERKLVKTFSHSSYETLLWNHTMISLLLNVCADVVVAVIVAFVVTVWLVTCCSTVKTKKLLQDLQACPMFYVQSVSPEMVLEYPLLGNTLCNLKTQRWLKYHNVLV